MKIKLINCTGFGNPNKMFAADLLIFTKSTRLNMTPDLMQEIQDMDYDAKMKELEYISQTIPSSWEFVDYTFLVQGVTRAFTHQIVRNRHGSYAQQTMRVLDVSGFDYLAGPSLHNNDDALSTYHAGMMDINSRYEYMIAMGAKVEDARGILPTNILTNIVIKLNLRTMAELAAKRASPRTQGEYREFLMTSCELIMEAHPWAELFLKNRKIGAAKWLDEFIESHASEEEKMQAIKMVDILRS